MHEWSGLVIEEAEKKGIKVDLVGGNKVIRSEVLSRIEKTSHTFIFLNGHGSSVCFFGYRDQPLIGLPEAGVLGGKVVFARACDCVSGLGKESVEKHNCRSFIGYEYEFINVRQTNTELKPLEDNLSRPIWEASNIVPISLIKGLTVSESLQSSHGRTAKEMSMLLYSEDPAERAVLKALVSNDEGLMFQGDGSARI